MEFECGHRFCEHCAIEQLRQNIERAEIAKLKCFQHDCLRPISEDRITQILSVRNLPELVEKFSRFKNQKSLDTDPLVRWCPKPNCMTHIRAENMEATKLTCPKCATEVCYKCRDEWHGVSVTCEEAIRSQLKGWVEENKDSVSFCPLCRTRIEKSAGCNHMTCGFCEY